MTHQNIICFSGRSKNLNSPISHILTALFQAEVCEAGEVVFGPSCRNPDGGFRWFQDECGTYAGIQMPDGLSGKQVREALIAMTGLDQSGQFPGESELVFMIPKSDFILEFQVDEKYETQESIAWRPMRWHVSLSEPEGPIVLTRRR
jgi:hypothetical protein